MNLSTPIRIGSGNATEFSFAASELDARAGIQRVMSFVGTKVTGPDLLGSIEIALSEAVNNVVEHAYADQQPGKVAVSCVYLADMLYIKLRDSGPAFDPVTCQEDCAPTLDLPRDALPEGGFGWPLIRELTQDVTYHRVGGENHLTLHFSLGGEDFDLGSETVFHGDTKPPQSDHNGA